MSRKELRMYNYGESILGEYHLFRCYNMLNAGFAYHEKHKPELKKLTFDWEWNNYSGTGYIHFLEGTSTVINESGEKFSQMNVSSYSARKPTNGKMYSPLYNDESLEELFNIILRDAKNNGII